MARRVPGVGPMPYERFGYALLPGWNGIDQPTSPPVNAQAPAAGTLWAEQLGQSRAGETRPGAASALAGAQPERPSSGPP